MELNNNAVYHKIPYMYLMGFGIAEVKLRCLMNITTKYLAIIKIYRLFGPWEKEVSVCLSKLLFLTG